MTPVIRTKCRIDCLLTCSCNVFLVVDSWHILHNALAKLIPPCLRFVLRWPAGQDNCRCKGSSHLWCVWSSGSLIWRKCFVFTGGNGLNICTVCSMVPRSMVLSHHLRESFCVQGNLSKHISKFNRTCTEHTVELCSTTFKQPQPSILTTSGRI